MAELLDSGKKKRKKLEEADSATAKDSQADSSMIANDGKTSSTCDEDKGDGSDLDDKRLKKMKFESESEEVPADKMVSVSNNNFEAFFSFKHLCTVGRKCLFSCNTH